MKRFITAMAIVAVVAFAAPAFAAMNPFMDVPASHWAYDAIAQLAARGVISGYPDGTYKGARPTTRYEMASALARALAKIDMEKADKQDVETLKRLIVEFKDELDALGVRVDNLDSRVAVLERDLGGWAISGQFRLDWKIGNSEGMYNDLAEGTGMPATAYDPQYMYGKNQFDLNRYRIYLSKRINETTSFFARIGSGSINAPNGTAGASMEWEHYYIATYLHVLRSTLVAGRVELDWERDLDLYLDNDSPNGHLLAAAMVLMRDFGKLKVTVGVGRLKDNYGLASAHDNPVDPNNHDASFFPELFEQYVFAGLFDYTFNERWRGGLMAYYLYSDSDELTYANDPKRYDTCTLTLGAYLGYKFTPSIELKGVFYFQDQGDYYETRRTNMYSNDAWAHLAGDAAHRSDHTTINEDNATYWRVILDIDQEALRFTSLWIEYGQMENNFWRLGQHGAYADMGADILSRYYMPLNTNTSKIFGVRADQKWNAKWRSFVRYWHVDVDTPGWDDNKQWGIGVAYRLNPAVEFELTYDHVDFGNNRPGKDDHLVRFRTLVNF